MRAPCRRGKVNENVHTSDPPKLIEGLKQHGFPGDLLTFTEVRTVTCRGQCRDLHDHSGPES